MTLVEKVTSPARDTSKCDFTTIFTSFIDNLGRKIANEETFEMIRKVVATGDTERSAESHHVIDG